MLLSKNKQKHGKNTHGDDMFSFEYNTCKTSSSSQTSV